MAARGIRRTGINSLLHELDETVRVSHAILGPRFSDIKTIEDRGVGDLGGVIGEVEALAEAHTDPTPNPKGMLAVLEFVRFPPSSRGLSAPDAS